jgi:hypothetical protein
MSNRWPRILRQYHALVAKAEAGELTPREQARLRHMGKMAERERLSGMLREARANGQGLIKRPSKGEDADG